MNFFSGRPASVLYVADKLFWVPRKKGGYAWHLTFRHVVYRAERGELVSWVVACYVWPCRCSEIKISMPQCFLLQPNSISAAQETFRWQSVDCTLASKAVEFRHLLQVLSLNKQSFHQTLRRPPFSAETASVVAAFPQAFATHLQGIRRHCCTLWSFWLRWCT